MSVRLIEENNSNWKRLDTKQVNDTDGFLTEYSLYKMLNPDLGEPEYVCILGDTDIYNPDNTEPDWEGMSRSEAIEWFEYFDGYYEDEDEDYFLNLGDTLKIAGERNYDGVHYYVLETNFSIDDISTVNALENELGFELQQMGYDNVLWVPADKSELSRLQRSIRSFNDANSLY